MSSITRFSRLLVAWGTLFGLILVAGAWATREAPIPDGKRVFEVRGKIVEIDASRTHLTISHEEMPGYMMAMTMPFQAASPVANSLQSGDAVSFRYVIDGSSFRIEDLRELSEEEAATLMLEQEPVIVDHSEASLYQMDARWTHQDGRVMRLGDFTGRPVVLSMIFTHCGYACPMIVADMKQIASRLPEDAAGDVQYVLVSLDPERDTPEALRRFAAAYGLNSDQWSLLRGEAEDVRTLAAMLGIRYRQQADGQFAHTSLITILDEGGEIVHRRTGSGTNADMSAVLMDLLVNAETNADQAAHESVFH